ncbi:unnamed protein product [Amoebophrya sp. A120]|nr:unnamed protein product [Amoebophrya sp. A120]|eukprot:GSA120T00001180001.1
MGALGFSAWVVKTWAVWPMLLSLHPIPVSFFRKAIVVGLFESVLFLGFKSYSILDF